MKPIETFYNESPTKQNTRQRIIDTCSELFASKGVTSVTMQRIANTCNITLRNLYRYYSNKDMLVIDVAYSLFYIVKKDMRIEIDLSMTGYDQVSLIIQHILDKTKQKIFGVNFNKFIQYFDLYIDNMALDNLAYIKYTTEYVKELNNDFNYILIYALEKGYADGSIFVQKEDIHRTAEYILQSIFSIISRTSIKVRENPNINSTLVDKHVDVLLSYLKTT